MEFARFSSGGNLVTNPGFEDTSLWSEVRDGDYPGTAFFRSTWGMAAPHGGSYAYTISNQAYGYLQSAAVNVQANTQYDLYAWLKGELDADDSHGGWIVRVLFYNAGDGYLGQVDAAIGGPGTISGSWAQKGGRVTTLPNTAKLRVVLLNYLNSGWVAFDDVTLIPASGGDNLLVANPGFENTSLWSEIRNANFPGTSFYRSNWGTAAPHTGSYAYAISNQVYGYLQSGFVNVQAETQYDLYAWIRGELDAEDSHGGWIVRALFYNASDGYLGQVDAASGGPGTISGSWAQKGGRFTTLANTAKLRVVLLNYLNSGWVAFDDVTLVPASGGDNLLDANPGFENTSLWSEVGYANFPGTSFFRSNWGIAAPRSGSYAYAISNHAYGYLQSQSIPVRAGTEYDVYAWVRGELDAEDSYGDWLLRAQFYTAGGAPINPPTDVDRGAVSGLSAAWQQQGGRVTAPDNAATMKIQLYNYMNSGWVAFDDVTIASEVTARRTYYAGSTRVAMRQGWGTGTTGLSYLLGDHLGSTSLVTDGSGANPITQLYKAWGEVRWSSASLPTKYTYTGQYSYVTDFGLLFFKARYYDPSIMRFNQPDSIIPDPSDPIAFDRYAYARNNPLRYSDPTGHWTEDELEQALGEDWKLKYFGKDAVFYERNKLLAFLLSENTTDPITLELIRGLFEVSFAEHSAGLDFSTIDALGARVTIAPSTVAYGGISLDVVLNLTSGEFSVFGSPEIGIAIGETAVVVGGVTVYRYCPSNDYFRGTAKSVGIVGGDVIGVNVEKNWGGVHQFQDPTDVLDGGFIGVGLAVPGAAVYGSLSFAFEGLRVDQAGYHWRPYIPPVKDVLSDVGEVIWNDILHLP